jgi:hypothetical protein
MMSWKVFWKMSRRRRVCWLFGGFVFGFFIFLFFSREGGAVVLALYLFFIAIPIYIATISSSPDEDDNK